MTPLHHVVTIGDLDLLAEFLVLCPESIRDTNINGETAFHITVMNDKYEELKILRGWMQRLHNTDSSSTENCVLNKPNREGNTRIITRHVRTLYLYFYHSCLINGCRGISIYRQ